MEFVERRLKEMFIRPGRWGGAEAFEMQVLLLLEIRYVMKSPGDNRNFVELYSGFLQRESANAGCRAMSASNKDVRQIAQVMKRFRDSL